MRVNCNRTLKHLAQIILGALVILYFTVGAPLIVMAVEGRM